MNSKKLAEALRAAGMEKVAHRAELHEFHDLLSPHESPEIVLEIELLNEALPPETKQAAQEIRHRYHRGDFAFPDSSIDNNTVGFAA